MKAFIIFLALMILFTSFLSYTSDLERYVKLQNHLKALAEDCACGSSLFADENEYAEGRLVIDEKSALNYTDFLTREAVLNMPPLAEGSINAEVKIYDDAKGYDGAAVYGFKSGLPGTVVTLTYTGPDMFRLPFLTLTEVTRTAVYQWE